MSARAAVPVVAPVEVLPAVEPLTVGSPAEPALPTDARPSVEADDRRSSGATVERKYGLPIKIVVVKNNYLGQVKWEQMVLLGNPEYGVDLAPIDFTKFAEACGGRGVTIEDRRACDELIADALTSPRPVVVQAVVDPLEVPLPARMTPGQALRFAESPIRGEPDRVAIATNAIGEKIREMV